ncbi:hypothetical protein FHH43_16055 [Clostridium perfringens]|nr:hypothetical protein [Clostridium perfringens]
MINREAMDSIKGIRFQEIRLLKVMLKLINEYGDIHIIAFPEYFEDVYVMGNGLEKIMEQDKEYSSDFSINSKEIKKALVSFLDIFLEYNMSKEMKFVFHTNTNYVKEKQSKMLTELNMKPLEKPILEYLSNEEVTEEIINIMKKIIIYSYREIYGERTSKIKEIEEMKLEQWKLFLSNISYEFGKPDLKSLEKEIINDIEKCRFFTPALVGKADLIKDCLLGLIGQRICEKEPLKRAINTSDIELRFNKLATSPIDKKFDPIYEEWEKILLGNEEEKDIRNLKEKIYDVCNSFSERYFNLLNRQATNANYDIDRLNKIQKDSLKTRVFSCMEEYFIENDIGKESYSEEELKNLIKELKLYVVLNIEELKKDYTYGLENKKIIESLVIMLIDQCFYCFEGEC